MVKTTHTILGGTFTFWLGLGMAAAIPVSAAPASGGDYEKVIRPLFSERCAECHSEEERSSGFSVATPASIFAGGDKYGQAVVAGSPETSPLLQVLQGHKKPRMPMGESLSDEEIGRVESWIRGLKPEETLAAESEEWRWPYEKPAKQEPPTVDRRDWVRNPVDAFILKTLEEAELEPAPEAPKRTLARRVYLDLVGVPPTPEELAAFLEDESPEAYEALIDKLLADPRYGERWGRHWLDLVRYGETSGLEGDGAIGNAWRYRDWVIDALNRDMPYDRFVTLQLAGADEHSKTRLNYQPDVRGHIPIGFLRLAPWDRSNLVADEVRQNYLNEVTAATGSIFLGLTIGCAQCHDHKYDPIPQRDFYRFQAFFSTVQVANDVEVPYEDKAIAARARKKTKEYEERLRDGPEKRAVDELLGALLKKLVAARKAGAKGGPPTSADLKLELRREDSTIFTAPQREKHAELVEAAKRTGDPEEQQALEQFEATLLKELEAAYGRPGADPLARFDALTVADVRAELSSPYAAGSFFSEDEQSRYQEASSKLEVFRRRLKRWKPDRADGQERARAAQRPRHRAHVPPGPGRLPTERGGGPGRLPQRGHGPFRAGRHRGRPLPPVPHPWLADDAGEVDRQPRQPADGPGDGQPDLATALRPGDRRHAEQLRQERRAADPPRITRLARPHVHRAGLEHQGDAPPVADLKRLSPGVREHHLRWERRRPGEPPPLAFQPPTTGGRGDPRRHPRRQRPAQPRAGRPEHLPSAAR